MYDVSYPGIVNWNRHVMEKLGYMVLEYNHNHIDATESYKNCIKNLIHAIDENINVNGTSNDRMDDYGKMKRNLEILQKFCESNFKLKKEKKVKKNKN